MKAHGFRMATLASASLALMLGCAASDESLQELPTWKVEAVPSVEIPAMLPTGEVVLEYPRGGLRLDNGQIVIVDQYAAMVRFFGPDGTLIRSVGRRGEGPGEFADPRAVCQVGSDGLYVWDYIRRSVIVLDTTGRFVREFRPEGSPQEIMCSPAGRLGILGIPDYISPPSGDGTRGLSRLWTADTLGRVQVTVAEVPYGENRPLGRLTRFALGGRRVYVGTSDSALVEAYRIDGGELPPVQIGAPSRAPTALQVERGLEAMLSIVPSREGRDRGRILYDDIPPPDLVPAYRELRVDPEGLLWAVSSALGDPETVLQVVDPMRGGRAELGLPADLHLFEIGQDYVLGALFSEIGEPRVVLYRFEREAL